MTTSFRSSEDTTTASANALAPISPSLATTASAAIAVHSDQVDQPLDAQDTSLDCTDVAENSTLITSIIQSVINELPLPPSIIHSSSKSASAVISPPPNSISQETAKDIAHVNNRRHLACISSPPTSNSLKNINLLSATHVGGGENLASPSPLLTSNSPEDAEGINKDIAHIKRDSRGHLARVSPSPTSNSLKNVNLSSTTHVGGGEHLASTSPLPTSESNSPKDAEGINVSISSTIHVEPTDKSSTSKEPVSASLPKPLNTSPGQNGISMSMHTVTPALSPSPKPRYDENLPTWISQMIQYLREVAENVA